MEYRFKTQVIFTVNADSEQEALQQLMDATGEELFPRYTTIKSSNAIRYNTMRAFESLQSPLEHPSNFHCINCNSADVPTIIETSTGLGVMRNWKCRNCGSTRVSRKEVIHG